MVTPNSGTVSAVAKDFRLSIASSKYPESIWVDFLLPDHLAMVKDGEGPPMKMYQRLVPSSMLEVY